MAVSSLHKMSGIIADGQPIGEHKRGLVVTVYLDPPSSEAHLRAFEEGYYGGPIFA